MARLSPEFRAAPQGTASHGECHPAPIGFAPPQSQQFQTLRREHGAAVPASLACSTRISMRVESMSSDLEVRDFGYARARAIGYPERALYLMPGAASSSRAASSTPSRSGSLR